MSAAVWGTLLLCVTFTASAGFKVVGPDGPVVGVVGEDLVLPCSLKPPTSAVDMDVVWLIGGDIVHHYKSHQDIIVQQLPDYRGRTSLFREELQRGNVSLKISSVRLSDANTYRCYIAAQTGTDEAPVDVTVEAVGSTPVISPESLRNGRVVLQCRSKGWFPQPQMEWMDGEERILSAGKTVLHIDSEEGFTIKRNVTVEERDGSRFICRVSNRRQTREQVFLVPRHLFGFFRHHWFLAVPILPFLLVCWILAYYMFKGMRVYKLWVISEFQWPYNDGCHLPGEDIKTYTDPYIICRPRGTDRVPVSSRAYKRITLDQLFSPDEDEPLPKVVILQGHSGYGKSITTRKIICDWASGEHYTERFDLVVLLRCRELNVEVHNSWRSLLELIRCPQRFKPVMESILQDAPHKVLFIIDGFDELKKLAAVPSPHLPSQPFTRAPPADTFQALLSGRMLPESFLLVTTRHTAADRLRETLTQRAQRFTEILGFSEILDSSENMVNKYFLNFPFEDQSTAVQAYTRLKTNSLLFHSCSIPILCWMMCSVLRRSPDWENLLELQNVSSIYLFFVATHLKDTVVDHSNPLKMLAKLAKEGTWKNEFLFKKENVSGFEKIPLLRRCGARNHGMYRFAHQSIQEFLSALYYLTLEEAEAQGEVAELLHSVKGPSADKNTRLVIRFLFGLSNRHVRQSLVEKQPSHGEKVKFGLSFDEATVTAVYRQLKCWIEGDFNEVFSLLMLQCLSAFQEKDSMKAAMEKCKSVEIISSPLKVMDCRTLIYCLSKVTNIEHLDLRDCNLTHDKLKLLQPMLSSLKCERLGLDVKDLSDTHVGDLITALGTERILRRLRVKNSQLSHDSVQKVLSALGNQKSVGSVHLSVKTVSLDTAEMLLTHLHKDSGIMRIALTGLVPFHGNGDYLCSSLSVGKEQHSFTVSLRHNGTIHQPAVSELSVTLPSCGDKVHWTDLLQNFQQLRELKSKSEVDYMALDDHVEQLLTSLSSLAKLQKVYLEAYIQTIEWAFQVFSLIHKCASLKEIDVMVRELEQVQREPTRSFLTVRKDQHSTVRLTVGQHVIGISCSQTTPALSLSPQENRPSPLSLVSLTFPDSQVHSKGWVGFLKTFDDLSRNRTANMERDINSLFSLLRSVSGLKEVELRLGSLTHTWAQHVLTLIREQPRDKEISVNVLKEWGSLEESLCSSLYVTKTSGTFRLAVEHLSQGNSTPALSYIGVVVDPHSETLVDWIDYVEKFHTLKRELERVYVYDYAAPLLSLLHSLSGLREVELRVSCLTDSWADLMLSLIEDSTSLQEVRLSAGRAVVSEGLSVCTEFGPLLLEDITHLRESLKHNNCTVTLTGIKRRTSEVSNPFREGRLQRNRPVKITIRGETYSEEPLDQ